MKQLTMKKSGGFSLIELLIVVALMGIILTIAVPSYRDYMRRTARTEAKSALLRLAANQEKFFLNSNAYAASGVLSDPLPGGLGIESTTQNGHYTITLTTAANGQTYEAQAAATGGQADDKDCDVYGINSNGQVYGGPGPNFTALSNDPECW